MSHCHEHRNVQPYLDGDLSASEAARFAAHAESCNSCGPELAGFRALFASLAPVPVRDPGPALTERILDKVLPSRLRRKWVTAIGWSYSAASAACTFLLASWLSRPETPVWLASRFGEASERAVRLGWWGVDALMFAWMHATIAVQLMAGMAERLVPLARALTLPLSHPAIGAAVWSAVLGCAILLWWLRARDGSAREEIRHVDIIGF